MTLPDGAGQAADVVAEYRRFFGSAPDLLAVAPGRVNLIGEHTDYNDGWVLPAAIQFHVVVAAGRRAHDDARVHVRSLDLDAEAVFDLSDRTVPDALWLRYPKGVASALALDGYRLRSMNALYSGDVPMGAGLSSSAAVEVAFAVAFTAHAGLDVAGLPLALAAQRAENEFVGVPSGLMDQAISALGQADHALLLDCRSLAFTQVAINLPEVRIVVLDTGIHRELASSKYARRRADCEAAVSRLQTALPGIRALRDVTLAELAAHRNLLDETLYKRARHVVEENERTLLAAQALADGDASRVGELMRASHESLRDMFEVSSPELDALVEIAWMTDGVVGARMTGGGFGGAAVALVHAEAIRELERAVASRYPALIGRQARVIVCTAASGAHVYRL